MRIKIDENIGTSGVELLRRSGHDVMTVREQALAGCADERIFQACVAERRTLVTLDRDFGQMPRFQPKGTAGIVILELGGATSCASCMIDCAISSHLPRPGRSVGSFGSSSQAACGCGSIETRTRRIMIEDSTITGPGLRPPVE